jgi:Flp pilus assembly pilin Flp
MRKRIKSTSKKERGASLVEYALLVALIAIGVLAAVRVAGTTARDTFYKSSEAISGEAIGPIQYVDD